MSDLTLFQGSGDPRVEELFNHWVQAMGKVAARTKLDHKRTARLTWALNTYDEGSCKLAIDGCAADPFSSGKNRQGKRYDSLEIIFRDAEHVEKFIEIAESSISTANDVEDWLTS